MGNVKTASTAVMDVDTVAAPAQAGPAQTDPQVTAQALAEALDPQLVARLAAQARVQGLSLLGRDGLLQQLTKRFLEATLDAEMDEHLGYGKHDPVMSLIPSFSTLSSATRLRLAVSETSPLAGFFTAVGTTLVSHACSRLTDSASTPAK